MESQKHKMEFQARKDKEGRLTIMPNIEKKTNATGGTDVTVHVPRIALIKKLNEIKEEDGERNIQ